MAQIAVTPVFFSLSDAKEFPPLAKAIPRPAAVAAPSRASGSKPRPTADGDEPATIFQMDDVSPIIAFEPEELDEMHECIQMHELLAAAADVVYERGQTLPQTCSDVPPDVLPIADCLIVLSIVIRQVPPAERRQRAMECIVPWTLSEPSLVGVSSGAASELGSMMVDWVLDRIRVEDEEDEEDDFEGCLLDFELDQVDKEVSAWWTD